MADPGSGSSDSAPSEASGSVWHVRREEIPLSRGESRMVLGERVRKREKPRTKKSRQTQSQTLTGTLGKNEVRASEYDLSFKTKLYCALFLYINGCGP